MATTKSKAYRAKPDPSPMKAAPGNETVKLERQPCNTVANSPQNPWGGTRKETK